MADLTPQERQNAKLIFEGKVEGREACIHCGGIHLRACRRVKRAEWHPDGSLLKVWYWPDGSWSEANTVWPEEIYDDEPEEEPIDTEKA